MGKPLNQQLIVAKTRIENISLVKNLNLWGMEIDDISILQRMPCLEVVVLSVNQISSLRDFSYLPQLKELYLRKNSISDLGEIKFLINLPKLKNLWLCDNQCAEVANYREIVIKALPQLEKLDTNELITQEERRNAQGVNIDFLFMEHDEQQPARDVYTSNSTKSQPQQQQQQQQQQPQQQQQQAVSQLPPSISKTNSEMLEQQQQQLNMLQQQQMQSQQQYQQQRRQSNMSPPDMKDSYYQTGLSSSHQNRFQTHMSNAGMEARNQNIVCAVLALIKELDENSLEIVRINVERKLGSLRMSYNNM